MRLDDLHLTIGQNCGNIRCEPEWSWRVIIPDFDVWYARAGRGELVIDGRSHDVAPGSIFCFFPGCRIVGAHDPKHPLSVTYVHFEAKQAASRTALRTLLGSTEHGRVRDTDWVERLARRTVELAKRPDSLANHAAEMCLKALLHETLLAINDVAAAPTSDAERMIAEVAASIRETPGSLVSVAELASRAGYQVDHFTTLFKRVLGLTPKEYCVRVRIERAKTLLSESTMSISAIAAALGYADVFFFSRQFTQRTGITPTAWRRRGG